MSDDDLDGVAVEARGMGDDLKAELAEEVKRLRRILEPSEGAIRAAEMFQAKRAAAVAEPVLGATDHVEMLKANVVELEEAHRKAFERARDLENVIAAVVSAAVMKGRPLSLDDVRRLREALGR